MIKEITMEDAEKILKDENEKNIKEQEKLAKHTHDHNHDHKEEKKEKTKKTTLVKKIPSKKAKPAVKKNKSVKKVSKK